MKNTNTIRILDLLVYLICFGGAVVIWWVDISAPPITYALLCAAFGLSVWYDNRVRERIERAAYAYDHAWEVSQANQRSLERRVRRLYALVENQRRTLSRYMVTDEEVIAALAEQGRHGNGEAAWALSALWMYADEAGREVLRRMPFFVGTRDMLLAQKRGAQFAKEKEDAV